MTGKNADRALEQIQYLWEAKKKKNRIQIRLPASETAPPVEDANREDPSVIREPSASIRRARTSSTRYARLVATQSPIVSDSTAASSDKAVVDQAGASEDIVAPASEGNENEGADIMIFRGPNGLIVTSDDPEALDEFEQLARMVTEQMSFGPTEPTVFYLKFIGAKAASELLNSILSGEASSSGSSSGGGGLLGSVLGEVGGGLVGSLLGGGGGGGSDVSTISGGMASGEISMTADPRLNCLVVRANAADLELITDLLETIDQEDSPIKIETSGKVRLIPVINNSVDDIAAVVKQVFADRIAAAASAGGGGGQQRQPSPQEFMEALRGGGGGRGGRSGGASSELKQATMTVGTDPKNNTLIISSSQNLYNEVLELVTMLDQAAMEKEEKVEVVKLDGSVNATVLQNALRATFGSQAKSTNVAASSTPTSSSSSTNSSSQSSSAPSTSSGFDPAAAAQRAEFFRQFQGGGPGGFGSRSGGPPGFGGGFGGPPGFGSGFGGGDRGGSSATPSGDSGRSRSRSGR
jgi:type II secretory pathway component GspD/PulD (secretin)